MITLLGIPFDFMGMTYYRTAKDVSVGETVIVETPHGTYPGKVTKVRIPSKEELEKKDFETLFPEILRVATFADLNFARNAITQGEKISKSTQELANNLNLNMKVLKSYLDIDEDKVLVTFTSDARVDFRELVRVLSTTYHLKIELRQIGPRDQAKLVFNECTSMRAKSPALRTIEKKRQSDIYTPFNDGIIKPLAAKTNNLDGLNAHGVIQDEWHEQKNSALYDVMVQSQSAREQPLYLLISTNGFLREAFFDAKYEYASNVALWVEGYHDYRTLALIYELDSREEWIDESCWEKANPGLRTIKKRKSL